MSQSWMFEYIGLAPNNAIFDKWHLIWHFISFESEEKTL